MEHKLGWIPDLPDARDADHAFYSAIPMSRLPKSMDLRPHMPPVLDQGDLGSCTANAIVNAHLFAQMKQPKPTTTHVDFPPSRLFVYYNERAMEHTVSSDSGAMIRDGMKSVAKLGVCAEKDWPYLISDFTKRPTQSCYTNALRHQSLKYASITQMMSQMKGCLASGFPFVMGFSVYESFESDEVANTGKAPMPGPGERQLGGHAVLCCGYDDAAKRWLVENSWGTGWGDKGYFTLPYEYLLSDNLSSDFWKLTLVEE